MKQFSQTAAVDRVRRYRKEILDISQQVGALHIAPAFSCLEITDVIYNSLMRINRVSLDIKDTFIMSKGHGCLAQYIILRELGLLSAEDLLSYCRPEGRLGAHPDYGVPGISASTGSLGHGLGISVGIAHANKLQNIDSQTYVVISDGELQEGSTWEAIMMAANLCCSNLTVFVDLNDFSALERMSVAHKSFYPVVDKLANFQWQVKQVNGHDSLAIYEAATCERDAKPLAIVCDTVKGKGVSYMENVPIWHYRSPNKEEYLQALQEVTGEVYS